MKVQEDELVIRAERALRTGSDNPSYYARLLDENRQDDRFRVTPVHLKSVQSSCIIVINEDVFQTICHISRFSRTNNLEIPFFLFGREEVDGLIYFDLIRYCNFDLEHCHASFKSLSVGVDKAMDEYLTANDAKRLLENFGTQKLPAFRRAVRCYGHSHPGDGGDCFTMADMECTVEHVLLNTYYASNEMGSLDVLITPSGDVNFIKYENNCLFEGFYKYDNAFVQMDSGRLYRLPSYRKGNYRPLPLRKSAAPL